MPVPYTDLVKEKQQQLLNLCMEARGEYLDLGKKISEPQVTMMEELKLPSNRGSRMFQERLKRVEKFTLEGVGNRPATQSDAIGQFGAEAQTDKTHYSAAVSFPERTELVTTLHHMVAKKGNPNVLAPGYSGPLQEIPHEKFNITVIPKSYCSPWEKLPASEALLSAISAHLPEPPAKLTPSNFRCFNRAPLPFGGTSGSERTLPLPGFELLQAYTEPNLTWERMCVRPNFNRTPRGWKSQYTIETVQL